MASLNTGRGRSCALVVVTACASAPSSLDPATSSPLDEGPAWDDGVVVDERGALFGAAAFTSPMVGGGAEVLAFGADGAVFRSDDLGATWSVDGRLGRRDAVLGGIATDGVDVAVGEDGLLRVRTRVGITSPLWDCPELDGWHLPCRMEAGAIPEGAALRSVALGGDDHSVLAVGELGTILRADLGAPDRWSRVRLPPWAEGRTFRSIARVGDANVVVGDDGFVMLIREHLPIGARFQQIELATLGLDPLDPPDLLDVVADSLQVETKWAPRLEEARLGYEAAFLVVGEQGTALRVVVPLRKPAHIPAELVVVERVDDPPWGDVRLTAAWSDSAGRLVAGEAGTFYTSLKVLPFAHAIWTTEGEHADGALKFVDVVGSGRARVVIGTHHGEAIAWRDPGLVPTCVFDYDAFAPEAGDVVLDVWRDCLGGEGDFPAEAFSVREAVRSVPGGQSDTGVTDGAPPTAPARFDAAGRLRFDVELDGQTAALWTTTVLDVRDPDAPVLRKVVLTPWSLVDRAHRRNPSFRFRQDLGGPELELAGREDLARDVMADVYTGWAVTAPGARPEFVGAIVDHDPEAGVPADRCGDGDDDEDLDGAAARLAWDDRRGRFMPTFRPDWEAEDVDDVMSFWGDPFRGVIASVSRLRSSVGQDYTDDVFSFDQGLLPRLSTMKQYLTGACEREAQCTLGSLGTGACTLVATCCEDGRPSTEAKYPVFAPFDGRLYRVPPVGRADELTTTMCGGEQHVPVDDTLDAFVVVSDDAALVIEIDHVEICRDVPPEGLAVRMGERLGRGSRWHGGNVVVWVREVGGVWRLVSYWDLLPDPLFRLYQDAFGMAERYSGEPTDPVVPAGERDACPLVPDYGGVTYPGSGLSRLVCSPTCSETARRDWIVHETTALRGSWEWCSP